MLPNMKYSLGTRKIPVGQFGGLDRTPGAGNGAICDMLNLSGDQFPLLSTRERRGILRRLERPGGLFSWGKLVWVDGTEFFYDGVKRGEVIEGRKTFVGLGSRVLVFPDKVYYDTADGSFGSMEASFEGSVVFEDGTLLGAEAMGNTIRCAGIDWRDYFREDDAVTISGCEEHPENNQTIIIREIDGEQLRFSTDSFTIGQESGSVRISRELPELDFVCACDNRLWGCAGNRIYASKLGDPFNFEHFDGLKTDAWQVDTGSAGSFTGCATYGGYPVFFKEDRIYKVYGTMPSNYEVAETLFLGVEFGSEHSCAVAGDVMFYLSGNGVTAYTGGIPKLAGAALGPDRLKNAVGGSDGLKYYMSAQTADESWVIYVYDTRSGLWHKEDFLQVTHFAFLERKLYFLSADGEIYYNWDMREADAQLEQPFFWYAEFADFDESSPNSKFAGKLQLRLELMAGSFVRVLMMFDSSGKWERLAEIAGPKVKHSTYIQVIPRRCDHYRIRLEGYGQLKVYSMTIESAPGTEGRM